MNHRIEVIEMRERVRWLRGAVKFSLMLAIIGAVLSGCSDDPERLEPVAISSISPDAAGAGDTVTIEGKGFDSGRSLLYVAFSSTGFSDRSASRLALPVSVTGSSLRAIVPEGSYTGGVRIETPIPLGSGPFNMPIPHVPSNSLDFSVRLLDGEVAKIFFSSADYPVPLSVQQAGEEYVMIVFNSAAPPSDELKDMTILYSVDSDLACTPLIAGEGEDLRSDEPVSTVRSQDAALSFERKRREEISEILKQVQPAAEEARPASPGIVNQPTTREFYVYSDITGRTDEPSSYTVVTADLKYEGSHTLLYLDSDTHYSCISDVEAEALGIKFESYIYPTNTASFGSESDINRDGKVVILLTPVVNELTPPGPSSDGVIAGFFLPADLLPAYVPSGVGNGMEIYYSMVPDPLGLYGNVFTKEYALDVMEGIMAHEFLHMIMFNYRVLINSLAIGYLSELWLDEGMAHVAEDLNGHDSDNIARANIFLDDPGDVTLIYGGDALGERGASFLFFRYLGDRFGDPIFRAIVQAKKTGTDNIEYVAGKPFNELFADWAATLYFESEEIVPADPKYSYSSIDLAEDFNSLRVRGSDFCLAPVTGTVKSMGPEYISMDFSFIDEGSLTVSSEALGRMNAVLIRIQ